MMRKRRVELSPEALQDMEAIGLWLTEAASSVVARRYLARLRKRLSSLAYGSERGTVHDNLSSGLRMIGITATVSVAFRVKDDRVTVLRVVYGGQDWQAALTRDDAP